MKNYDAIFSFPYIWMRLSQYQDICYYHNIYGNLKIKMILNSIQIKTTFHFVYWVFTDIFVANSFPPKYKCRQAEEKKKKKRKKF